MNPTTKPKLYEAKTELKGEIDNLTIIVGDFNILLSIMDRTMRQKIKKDIKDLNSTINQLNLIDTHKTLHPITEYTFF